MHASLRHDSHFVGDLSKKSMNILQSDNQKIKKISILVNLSPGIWNTQIKFDAPIIRNNFCNFLNFKSGQSDQGIAMLVKLMASFDK